MDLTPNKTPQPTSNTNTNSKKSSFIGNGFLKRHRPITTVPPPPQPPSTAVFYKECLKNHALGLNGLALDGCGEFMYSSSNPSEPRYIMCAACGCHRNFHRQETQEYPNPNFISYYPTPQPQSVAAPPLSSHGLSLSTTHSLSRSLSPVSSPSPPPLSHHFPPSYLHPHNNNSAPHMLLALGNACSDEHQQQRSLNFSVAKEEDNPKGTKRHRTTFSKEQKEKMQGYAEKLGWRILKEDEDSVQEFCDDIGVSKGVFRVWMHNHKSSYKKKLTLELEMEMGNAQADENTNGDADGNGNGADEKTDGDGNGNGGGEGGSDGDVNNPDNTSSSNIDISGN